MKRRELAGQRFGKLLVIEPTEQRVRNAVVWRCRCDCGNEIEVTKRRLITGNTRSCGCAKISQMNDLTGKRFGKLTVLSYVGKENGFHIWHCRCDCGKTADVRQSNLQSGRTKSCGCDRNPQKNMHYTEGTCLEMLRPELMYKTNTSGVRGVYYNKKRNKWIAQIMF